MKREKKEETALGKEQGMYSLKPLKSQAGEPGSIMAL